jgi:formylglycine-generating enzyme required for sulfatase activity
MMLTNLLLVPLLLAPGGTGAPAPWPRKQPRTITNSIGMKLVLIPNGKFTMGSPKEEETHDPNEELQHEVELAHSFYLGVHEVTQGQFRAVMGHNPSYFSTNGKGKEGVEYGGHQPGGGKDLVKGMDTAAFPVENVSWQEAVEFCRLLTRKDGRKPAGMVYRLPSEVEWEYCCRAGTSTAFHFGASLSSTHANMDGTRPYGGAKKGPYLGRTCAVGTYRPNAFGLYDMHGNVCEWCHDWDEYCYRKMTPVGRRLRDGWLRLRHGSNRVYRGGSYWDTGFLCRSARRQYQTPTNRFNYLGFRVALSLPVSRK